MSCLSTEDMLAIPIQAHCLRSSLSIQRRRVSGDGLTPSWVQIHGSVVTQTNKNYFHRVRSWQTHIPRNVSHRGLRGRIWAVVDLHPALRWNWNSDPEETRIPYLNLGSLSCIMDWC